MTVQTAEQYVFIHQVLAEYAKENDQAGVFEHHQYAEPAEHDAPLPSNLRNLIGSRRYATIRASRRISRRLECLQTNFLFFKSMDK